MRFSASSRSRPAPPNGPPSMSRSSTEASPLVIHTTLARPPERSTRWMTPAQQSVSSSGCGATTRSEVPVSIGGRASGVAGAEPGGVRGAAASPAAPRAAAHRASASIASEAKFALPRTLHSARLPQGRRVGGVDSGIFGCRATSA